MVTIGGAILKCISKHIMGMDTTRDDIKWVSRTYQILFFFLLPVPFDWTDGWFSISREGWLSFFHDLFLLLYL